MEQGRRKLEFGQEETPHPQPRDVQRFDRALPVGPDTLRGTKVQPYAHTAEPTKAQVLQQQDTALIPGPDTLRGSKVPPVRPALPVPAGVQVMTADVPEEHKSPETKPMPANVLRVQQEAFLSSPMKSERGLKEATTIGERALARIQNSPARRRQARKEGREMVPSEQKVDVDLPPAKDPGLWSKVKGAVGPIAGGVMTVASTVGQMIEPVSHFGGEVISSSFTPALGALAVGGAGLAVYGLKKLWDGMRRGKEIAQFKTMLSHYNANWYRLTGEQRSDIRSKMQLWDEKFGEETKNSMPDIQEVIDELDQKFRGSPIASLPEETTYERGKSQLQRSMQFAQGGSPT